MLSTEKASELGTMAHAAIPALKRLRNEKIKFEACLGYIGRPYLKV